MKVIIQRKKNQCEWTVEFVLANQSLLFSHENDPGLNEKKQKLLDFFNKPIEKVSDYDPDRGHYKKEFYIDNDQIESTLKDISFLADKEVFQTGTLSEEEVHKLLDTLLLSMEQAAESMSYRISNARREVWGSDLIYRMDA